MYSVKIDENGMMQRFGLTEGFTIRERHMTLASPIMNTVEQRIHDAIRPHVKQAQADFEAIITIELGKLGIKAHMTSMAQFADSIGKQYHARLVEERVAAIVDDLVARSETSNT
jgi:hypothetical protein